jgi:hypothetical protein
MISTKTTMDIIRYANDLYKSKFKTCFVIALVFSIITEYVKIYLMNIGIDNALTQYFATGKLPNKLQSNTILTCLACLSVVTTIIIHGLIISFFRTEENNIKSPSKFRQCCEMFSFLKLKIGKFCYTIVVKLFLLEAAQFLTIIGYFFGIIGIWLITSLSLIILPMILFETVGVINAYKKTINLMYKNSICALQIGFITILMLSIKNIVNVILYKYHINGSLNTGMMHVITIFIEALVIPYIIILTISFYNILNEAITSEIK